MQSRMVGYALRHPDEIGIEKTIDKDEQW